MSDHDEHGFAHPIPMNLLLGVFVALIFLTILTVLTAGQVPAPFGIYVAMTIATAKAALVMMFFMHMFWDKSFNSLVFLSSVLFVALFIGITLMDTGHYLESIDLFPRAADAP